MGFGGVTVIVEPIDVLVCTSRPVAFGKFNRPQKHFDRYREDGYLIVESLHNSDLYLQKAEEHLFKVVFLCHNEGLFVQLAGRL
jgi:hypothetical protein